MALDITDETLMAYADNELPMEQRQYIEEQLALDPALQQRLAVYQNTGVELSDAYTKAMKDPIPEAFVDLIKNHKNLKPSLFARLMAFGNEMFQRFLSPATTIAAALFLFIGLSIGGFFANSGHDHLIVAKNDKLYANSTLNKALETLPSEQSTPWKTADGKKGFVVSLHTFLSKDKQYCREFETAIPNVSSSLGVACREKNGQWLVKLNVVQVPVPKSVEDFRPASGTGLSSINGFIEKEMVGKALDFDKEAAKIKSGWK